MFDGNVRDLVLGEDRQGSAAEFEVGKGPTGRSIVDAWLANHLAWKSRILPGYGIANWRHGIATGRHGIATRKSTRLTRDSRVGKAARVHGETWAALGHAVAAA